MSPVTRGPRKPEPVSFYVKHARGSSMFAVLQWSQVVASVQTSMAARCVKFSGGPADLLAVAEHQVKPHLFSLAMPQVGSTPMESATLLT